MYNLPPALKPARMTPSDGGARMLNISPFPRALKLLSGLRPTKASSADGGGARVGVKLKSKGV